MANQLLTKWGRALDENHIHQEYPRPQFVRNKWVNLNGFWDYAITKSDDKPNDYQGEILVPYSPESTLSQVNQRIGKDDTLWYHRTFQVEKEARERVILHFGAVDQCCEVWVNDCLVGSHEGGYLPFQMDVSNYLAEENTLLVKVKDASQQDIYSYGKQSEKRGGIWYTPQSGIWQTVWLEIVPKCYVTDYKLAIDFDKKTVGISLSFNEPYTGEIIYRICNDSMEISKSKQSDHTYTYNFNSMIPWTPDNPHLYEFEVEAGADRFTAYFGMRKFSLIERNGVVITALNNEPFFHNGLLDQGYSSDGLYTYASDEAMIWELEEIKKMGFNMLRKHIKIEPLRWYYHCDRLGIVVWQDFINGGYPYKAMMIQVLPFIGKMVNDNYYALFGRKNEAGRQYFEKEMLETIDHLKNCVSLGVWVPFNEGWGQFDANRIAKIIKEKDPSRLVDHASGWHDQGGGDFKSYHVYYRKVRMKNDQKRALILSEFGGYSVPSPGHMYGDKLFGYKVFKNYQQFNQAYIDLYEKEVLPHLEKGLCATVYTQVSDVEDEINGLFTFNRAINKKEWK